MSTPSDPQRRGPYAKTAERRSRIGSAALEIVLEHGHAEVTPAGVAHRAGLTAATVTYHFPTRDDLLIAALTAREVGLQELPVDQILHAGGPLVALEHFLRGRESNVNYLALFGAMAAAAADRGHPAHDWLAGHHRAARGAMSAMLRLLQESGDAHPDVDPERFARQIVAVWDGLQTQWLADPDFDLPAEVLNAFKSLARTDTMEAKRAIEALAAEL